MASWRGPDSGTPGTDGKGDHRHVEGREEPYGFTDENRFVEDFLADRRRLGGK